MSVKEIVEKLQLKVYSGRAGLERKVSSVYVSDLLSDVMGNAREGDLWITLQTHKNIMAISSLRDLSAVILVKGLQPEEAALEKSEEEGIPILGSEEETFPVAGKLYKILNG